MTTRTYSGDLAQALADPSIQPGDRMLLKYRTRSGDFLARIAGTAEKPITLMPFAGRPKIDGSIYARGRHFVIRGLEICDADFINRLSAFGGSLPPDIPMRDGARLENPGGSLWLDDCVIHDCRQGVLKDIDVTAEITNSIVYYNGWSAPDRGHGHGLYAGNRGAALLIRDCIAHHQFGFGLHAYAEGNDWAIDYLHNIIVDGCTFFCNGKLHNPNAPGNDIIGGSGAGTTVRGSSMTNCCFYQDSVQIGGISTGTEDFILKNNVFAGDVAINYFGSGTVVTGNRFHGRVAVKDALTGNIVDAKAVFPDNTYGAGVPDFVSVRPNHVTIYNGAGADVVTVTVPYAAGTVLTLRNVQDYFNDTFPLTVSRDKTIAVPMTGRTVAAPQGWNAPASTFPKFGAFVLENI